jgi:hypothetical protein
MYIMGVARLHPTTPSAAPSHYALSAPRHHLQHAAAARWRATRDADRDPAPPLHASGDTPALHKRLHTCQSPLQDRTPARSLQRATESSLHD